MAYPPQSLKCYFVLFRVTLHIDDVQNLFSVSSLNTGSLDIETVLPYAEAGGGFLFSIQHSIKNWSYALHNHTVAVKRNAEIITSFHHLSPNKLIVRGKGSVILYQRMAGNGTYTLTKRLVCNLREIDGSTIKDCAHTTSSDLGPIAIDHSKTAIYYADGYKVQRVVNISAPNLPMPIKLDESLGDVTAMAFNEDYSYLFTIQKRDLTQTIRMYDLTSLQPARSVQLVEYDNEILQAFPLVNGIILCRNSDKYLVLLNTYTGQFSRVSEGTTYLPCGSSECGQDPLKIRDLTSYNHLHTQRGYFYGVNKAQTPIAWKYNSKY